MGHITTDRMLTESEKNLLRVFRAEVREIEANITAEVKAEIDKLRAENDALRRAEAVQKKARNANVSRHVFAILKEIGLLPKEK
jgi:uncharacterized NAD(P)/FAD-binding protein YdhS